MSKAYYELINAPIGTHLVFQYGIVWEKVGDMRWMRVGKLSQYAGPRSLELGMELPGVVWGLY